MPAFPGTRRLRARRIDHGAAMPVARTPHAARASSSGSPHIRPTRPTNAPTAEPGKILHEMRAGEMANLGEVPFGLYYGSVDSTPLFVLLAGRYAQTTGDLKTLRELWPSILRALAWIDGPGDRDGDGFVEYFKTTPTGSPTRAGRIPLTRSFTPTGGSPRGRSRLPRCRAMSTRQRSSRRGAPASWVMPQEEARLDGRGRAACRARFEEAFWCEDIGTYALALDGDKRPCRVRPRMPAKCCSAASRAATVRCRVAKQLMEPNLFSGWGVRTVSVAEPRYNPMSYHNGSVWPHDNAMIALGLARYDETATGDPHFRGACSMPQPTWICAGCPSFIAASPALPAAGRRFTRWLARRRPGRAAAFYALLEACLGIEPDPWSREIRFRNPALPGFLDEVVLQRPQGRHRQRRSCGAATWRRQDFPAEPQGRRANPRSRRIFSG